MHQILFRRLDENPSGRTVARFRHEMNSAFDRPGNELSFEKDLPGNSTAGQITEMLRSGDLGKSGGRGLAHKSLAEVGIGW